MLQSLCGITAMYHSYVSQCNPLEPAALLTFQRFQLLINKLGWLMGLEPTTTGITTLSSLQFIQQNQLVKIF